MSESYAEQLKDAKVMLSALKNNLSRLEKRGLNQEFIAKFENSYQHAQELDNEQEVLKTRLKEKSTELANYITAMSEAYREAKKLVKIEFPSDSWRQFGIEDSK